MKLPKKNYHKPVWPDGEMQDQVCKTKSLSSYDVSKQFKTKSI